MLARYTAKMYKLRQNHYMAQYITLTQRHTTLRFGMKIVAVDKNSGLYLGSSTQTGAVEAARTFTSVTEAKEFCTASAVTNYKIIAHLPGAVSGTAFVLAETGASGEVHAGKPRFA